MISIASALEAYEQPDDDNSKRMGMDRPRYRDYVIDLYLGDTENRYRRFKQQLNGADRGSALAGDLVLLGLTGATALAGTSSAEDLATVTAIAAGTRAVVDKRLFFDRTMPAVIAAMDARRATIKAEIAARRRLPEDQYTLGEAIADIVRLADAGDINVAIEQITTAESENKAAAEARLATIAEGCSFATSETALLNAEFMTFVANDTGHRDTRLAAAASLLDAKAAKGAALTPGDVGAAFDRRFCNDDAERRTFINNFKAQMTAAEGAK
jgi:hypothetical protein